MPRTPEVYPTACWTFSQSSNGLRGCFNVLPLRRLNVAFSRRIFFEPSQKRFFRRPLTAACLLILLTTCHASLIPTYGQSANATLSGTVIDQNNAVVPEVKIAVINIEKGFERSATTKDDGTFLIPLLPPGNYTVKAEREGFTPAEVRDVVLNVNDQRHVKIPLKVGGVDQTVDIVDTSPVINESPAVATVIDRQFVSNLPLNGRSFQSLITQAPGVVLTRTNGNNPGQFSVNGQRTNTNYFTVDGVSANIGIRATNTLSQTAGGSQPGLNAFGGTNNLVSIDALQEFKILTSTYAPEFGRMSGAQVSIVTRSGENEFHGSLFEYFRNDALDANDWFNNASRTKSPLRQNDFGGVFSGPILLPRFGDRGGQPSHNGRSRTFFFFSYEGLRQRLPQVAVNVSVPSLNLRQAAPAALQPLLRAFPLPTGPENPATQLAPLSAGFSTPASLDATSLRIDHIFNDRVTLFGRFNHAPSEAVLRGAAGSTLSTVNPTQIKTQTLTIGSTQIFNARVSNELRGNWSRTTAKSFFFQDDFGGAVPPADSVWFPSFASRENDRIFLSLQLVTGITVGNIAANQQRHINIVDSLSVVAGNHSLKFGVDYRRLLPIYGPQNYFQSLTFDTAAAVRSGTVSSLEIGGNQGVLPIYSNYSAFAQDSWKINQRLTLTYGVRYEVNPPPSEANGKEPFNVIGLDNPSTARLAPAGTPLYKTTYNNFAPRIGFAYRLFQEPGQETVLRGGFGIFYDLGNGQTAQGFTSVPFAGSRFDFDVPYPLSVAAAAPFSFNLTPPFSSPVRILAFDPNLKLPRTYQWNLGLERSLGLSQTVSASYVAAAGRQLLRQIRLINPVPSLGSTVIDVTNNDGTSDYHSLQLQYNRRLSRGLQALASYTWSHSIDDASDEFFDLNLTRGPSDFDIRHVFNAAFTYDLPTPSIGRVGQAILRNFSLDAIVTARSAAPVNVVARLNQTLLGQRQHVRPDLISGVPLYLHDDAFPGGRRFNPAAFRVPPVGRQGTLGRNALRGFPLSQVDLSLRRQFNLTERWNLLLRADVFNVFNHPNFGDPEFNAPGFDFFSPGNPNFGLSRFMYGRAIGRFGGGFSPLYQVGGPRSIQLSFKLQF